MATSRPTSRCRSPRRRRRIRAKWPPRLRPRCVAPTNFQRCSMRSKWPGPDSSTCGSQPAARQQVVREVLQQADRFGVSDAHAGEQVMVEFVSANPTGPLHLGHARQAALGDALANLLAAQGWQRHARVLLQRRRRADRNAGAFGAGARERTEGRGHRISRKPDIAANTSPRSRATIWRTRRSSVTAASLRRAATSTI